MKLRNGSIYTPELNKHYYYSLSLSSQWSRKKGPRRPKGHSLSRSGDRESARSAHSFNFDFNKSDGGGGDGDSNNSKSLFENKQEELNSRSKDTVIFDNQSIEEVQLKENIFGWKSTDTAMKEVASAEEITEIKTSTTNYLSSFSQKENLFLKEVHKTSTPVQSRSINQYTYVSYDNNQPSGQSGNGKQKQKRQKFSRKKQITANENEEDVFANTLEDHIFHDTSYKRVTSFENDQATESSVCDDQSFHYLYKLNGSSLRNYSEISDDEEVDVDLSFVNHYKRGLSRQKRRDWYLNRRNFSGEYVSNSSSSTILQYWIILIKTVIFSLIQKTINLFRSYSHSSYSRVGDSYFRSSYLWLLVTNIYSSVKAKSYSILTWLMINTQSFMYASTIFIIISPVKKIFSELINFFQILKTTSQSIVINR